MEKKKYTAPLASVYVIDPEEMMDKHLGTTSGGNGVDIKNQNGGIVDGFDIDNNTYDDNDTDNPNAWNQDIDIL